MRILLTEEELQNIVATMSHEDIKTYHSGEFRKWNIERVEEGYALEYIYTEKGDVKTKFAKQKSSEVKNEKRRIKSI